MGCSSQQLVETEWFDCRSGFRRLTDRMWCTPTLSLYSRVSMAEWLTNYGYKQFEYWVCAQLSFWVWLPNTEIQDLDNGNQEMLCVLRDKYGKKNEELEIERLQLNCWGQIHCVVLNPAKLKASGEIYLAMIIQSMRLVVLEEELNIRMAKQNLTSTLYHWYPEIRFKLYFGQWP